VALVLRTTSQIISHHAELEKKSVEEYRALAERHPGHMDVFNRLAEENKRHMARVERAYRFGVTDAYEVGITSTQLDPGDYALAGFSGESLEEDVATALRNEETVIRFCLDASKTSGELLPDLPDTFDYLVKRKRKRVELLRGLT
jgi:rubrerythrin